MNRQLHLKPGDVVRLVGPAPRMTVAHAAADSVRVQWFDAEGTLHVRYFDSEYLEVVRRARPNDLKVGDRVRLRSGGPVMTVADPVRIASEGRAWCRLPDGGGSKAFDAAELEVVKDEREATEG